MNHSFIYAYGITVNNFRMRIITHAASFGRAVPGVTFLGSEHFYKGILYVLLFQYALA